MEIKEDTKEFIENRQPGLILEKFDFEEEGEKRRVILRYIKIDDFPDFTEVIKARWKERAEMESEGVPEIPESEVKEIKNSYKERLAKCQDQGPDYFKDTLDYIKESFCDPKKALFIVMTVDEKIIGYIEIGHNMPSREQEAIWVNTISLLPEYQGKKIEKEDGQKVNFSHLLFEVGVAQARREEILKDKEKVAAAVFEWRPRAIKFWMKEGFKKEEPQKEESKTFGPHSIKMVKKI